MDQVVHLEFKKRYLFNIFILWVLGFIPKGVLGKKTKWGIADYFLNLEIKKYFIFFYIYIRDAFRHKILWN